MAPNNTCIDTLLAYINWNYALQTRVIITQQAMDSKQAYHAKIAQHLQHIAPTTIIISISSSELDKTFLLLLQDLNNRGLLH